MRWRSWARGKQKESSAACGSMITLNHTNKQMTTEYYAATTAPERRVSPEHMLSQPSCCSCDIGCKSHSPFVVDAVKR